VDYYDVPTPLNQVATINVPEARLIVIQPWDRSTLANIQKAILKSDLGLNPTNDGNVIRLVLSPPTEERRKELVKVIRKRLEDRKITIRNLRREALEELKNLEKNKEISQDELARVSNQLQKLTDGFIAEVDQMGQDKEAEIMEI
jgi:ribosome recycling factor